jgi:bifunctional non-homologous end joining protein LigD
MALPQLIRPMMASLRHGLPEDQDRYGWEFKWDGVRAIGYVDGRDLRLVSRNDKDMASSYPELGVLADRIGTPVILDGEIVALRDGRPDFGLLQSRMHVQRPTDRLVRSAPVKLYVFDLLHHGTESLLRLPYPDRRERLEALGLDAEPIRTPPWYRDNATDVLTASLANGLEGVVGKPLSSRYHPGQRRDWIKVKNVRHQEVIICGWKPGEGRRADMIGSLLLGVYDNRRLRYVGHVGTGFTQAMLTDLMGRIGPLERPSSPFATPVPAQHARDAHWVEPRHVGEVAFTEWTPEQIMRHPSWRGLRPDKNPEDIHREDLASGVDASSGDPRLRDRPGPRRPPRLGTALLRSSRGALAVQAAGRPLTAAPAFGTIPLR